MRDVLAPAFNQYFALQVCSYGFIILIEIIQDIIIATAVGPMSEIELISLWADRLLQVDFEYGMFGGTVSNFSLFVAVDKNLFALCKNLKTVVSLLCERFKSSDLEKLKWIHLLDIKSGGTPSKSIRWNGYELENSVSKLDEDLKYIADFQNSKKSAHQSTECIINSGQKVDRNFFANKTINCKSIFNNTTDLLKLRSSCSHSEVYTSAESSRAINLDVDLQSESVSTAHDDDENDDGIQPSYTLFSDAKKTEINNYHVPVTLAVSSIPKLSLVYETFAAILSSAHAVRNIRYAFILATMVYHL
jgi:hypothetical protein